MKSNTEENKNFEDQDIVTNNEGTEANENPGVATDTSDNMSGATDSLSPEEEAAVWRDKFVRLSAEYDNYRKRTTREKMEIIEAGGEDVVRSMLDVLDDMDRALEAIAKTDDIEAV
ncbi:MAG: nucleotide exchange factor GrpE, partial [Alistipes sp.]|nr:nucleotide exchange factor GrpE [Alistipes sp.]